MSKRKPRVREAKDNDLDRGLFATLWKEFLEDQFAKGSHIRPTDENVKVFLNIYDNYLSGKFAGVVLFVGLDAVCMMGDTGNVFDSTYGKIAKGWGTYVRPNKRGQGISKRLREAGYNKLREMGFDNVFGDLLLGNTEGEKSIKWEPYATLGRVSLKEEAPSEV